MSTISTPAKNDPNPIRISERRIWVRYSCDLDIQCRSDKGGSPKEGSNNRGRARFLYNNLTKRWPARVSNISRGGMKLEVGHDFEKGTTFQIELDRGPRLKSRMILARVTNKSQKDTALWSLGCEFLSPISQEDLDILLLFGPAGLTCDESIIKTVGRSAVQGISSLVSGACRLLGL
jgi:hypothetical protein